ncbi:MAG: helix-turn-helix domain-containing protein [Acidobacteriota bacterium]
MSHVRYDCNLGCPVEASLEVIGGKWKGVILFNLLSERLRFSEIRRLIPEVTQKTLTKQLRELESEGIVLREVYPEVPPRVEYSLTAYGKTLEPVLHALQIWGSGHLERTAGAGRATGR